MANIELNLDLNPAQADLDQLVAGLQEHSLEHVVGEGFEPIAVFARDSSGQIAAGASGFLNWTWLNVSLLWTRPDFRGQGLGSRVLSRIESAAKQRGCTSCHLSTFSYQAQEFYAAKGYRVFAELPDYPDGHSKLFLKKSLVAE